MISAICIYTGKTGRIHETVAAWQSQTLEGSELVIINCQLRQRLKTDIPGIRIVNMTRPIMPPQARNMAIEMATGDVIVTWPEDDLVLPNHLQNISTAIEGKDWCWLDKELQMEGGKIKGVVQSGTNCFAFTKKAWLGVGKYSFGVGGASDRNFIGKLTEKFTGDRAILNPSHVSYIRAGTENEKRANVRMALPGDLVLKPELKQDYAGLVRFYFGGRVDKKIAVVMLGRNGDIINAMPFFKLIHDNYEKPHVIIAREFLPLFDGISYCTPVVMAEKEEELGNALAQAKREYQIVVRAQIWGKGHSQLRECESYNKESWRDMGLLHRFNDETLRPVFDKRDAFRELDLISSVMKDERPILLVQLTGGRSSPCPACPSLMPSIQERFGKEFQIVDLSQMRAEQLYDFVGLMEKSAAIVGIDSAFLHLAAATNIPVVALTNPKPWAGTVVRMNCVAHIPYDRATAEFELVHNAIELAVQLPNDKIPPDENCRYLVERKVWHCVDRFEDLDAKILERKKQCWASWDELYATGELIPAHGWHYSRNAADILGDRRRLPYLKDLLFQAIKQADDADIILWTNDDNLLHPQIAEYLKFHVAVYGACSMFRTEFRGKPASIGLTPEQYAKSGIGNHIGRDGFAFTKAWLMEHWQEIGDVVLGASDWDIYLAAFIRLVQYGIKTTKSNLGQQIFPAEIPTGYTGHLAHHSTWNTPDVNSVPSNRHNRLIFRNWALAALPDLKFTENNTL